MSEQASGAEGGGPVGADTGRAAGERRRSERARQAILRAADELLAERGYRGVTIEGIAARAGVGKQTIYRWWSSKAQVLLEEFVTEADRALRPPDTGSTYRDLQRHLRDVAAFLDHAPAGQVLRALIGEAQHDPDIAVLFRTAYLDRQRELDRQVVRRGIERGDIAPDTDIDAVLDMLYGPAYYRVLVTGAPLSGTFVDGVVETVLAALTARARHVG